MKNILLLIALTFVALSCSKSGDRITMVVDVDPAEVLISASKNQGNEKFMKILEAARNGEDKDIVRSFFKEAERLYPDLYIKDLFRSVQGELEPSASNDEVLKYLLGKIDQQFDAAIEILSNRLENEVDVISAISKYDRNELVFELDAVSDSLWLYRCVQQSAKVEMFEVYAYQELASILQEVEFMSISDSTGNETLSSYLSPWDPFSIGYTTMSNKEAVDRLLISDLVRSSFPRDVRFMWLSGLEMPDMDSNEKFCVLYACKVPPTGIPRVDSRHMAHAAAGYNNYDAKYTIDITMTQEGAEAWGKMTEDNVQRVIAICMNGEVMSAPMVQEPIISGNTQISGSYTEDEVEEWAQLLNGGSLPIRCSVKSIRKH